MLKKIMIAALSSATLALGAAGAQAQDAVIVDDEEVVVQERVVEPDDDVIVDDGEPGPRVYGWVAERPLDCGAYHYWDGSDCIDARAVPPDTGYKD